MIEVASTLETLVLKPTDEKPKKHPYQVAEKIVDLLEIILKVQEKASSNLPKV